MSHTAALFGQTNKQSPRHLLQFKAGKLTENIDHIVSPDPRKGWAYVYQCSDGKLNFCWIDRDTRQVEDDTNEKNDTNLCNRVNNLIKSPPAQGSSSSARNLAGLSGLSQLTHNELLSLLSMGVGLGSGLSSESDVSSAQAIASTIGRGHLNTTGLRTTTTPSNPARSAPPPPQAPKKSTETKFQLSDLRNILSSVSSVSAPVELSNVLNMSNLKSLFDRSDVRERLLPHLPPTDPELVPTTTEMDRITSNVRSEQFRSTLTSFSSAFRTGALAPALAQFKLGESANEAARHGDLVAFSQALQSTPSNKNNDDDNNSAVKSSEDQQAVKSEKKSPDEGHDDDGHTPMDTD